MLGQIVNLETAWARISLIVLNLLPGTRRVLRSGGKVALAFTPQSGRTKAGLIETITAAGFVGARMVETDNFCVLATRP
jgi:hypothetical protein